MALTGTYTLPSSIMGKSLMSKTSPKTIKEGSILGPAASTN